MRKQKTIELKGITFEVQKAINDTLYYSVEIYMIVTINHHMLNKTYMSGGKIGIIIILIMKIE